ncbi:ribonuclease H2, subunit B [Rhizoctonia solani]|nr:ribonuclease H2, subunit B [Rhizoctonia solani]
MSTHVAVLPKDIQESIQSPATSLRPLRLPHPRTGVPALFIHHGSTLLELHSVTPDAPRSWFVGQSVVSNGNLLLMTPIDPAFILIPFLKALDSKVPFQPTDDLLEKAILSYSPPDLHKEDVAAFMALDCARRALRQLCETKDVPPDITVHRPSTERITAFIKRRIDRVVSAQQPAESPSSEPAPESTSEPTPISASEPPQSFPTIQRQHLRLGLSVAELGPLGCPKAQATRAATRIKIASEIIGNWVEDDLMEQVLATYDISAYIAHAAIQAEQARAELAAATARAEAAEVGKGGKSKAGEKRKAGPQASRGVDKLKKANTKGMAPLATFFGKKE